MRFLTVFFFGLAVFFVFDFILLYIFLRSSAGNPCVMQAQYAFWYFLYNAVVVICDIPPIFLNVHRTRQF